MLLILVLCVLNVYGGTLEEGDYCENNRVSGICKNVRKCPSVIEGIRKKEYPQTCSFSGSDPVVCCPDTSAKALVTEEPTTSVLVETYPPLPPPEDQCEPIPPTDTAEKTGQKAWDQCIEHQQQLLFPCVKNVFSEGYSRRTRCLHNGNQLIDGGTRAQIHEFPHMAFLGFKEDSGNITWEMRCAGALVHERFVLSSAHCVQTRAGVAASHVQLSSQRENSVHAVRKIVRHPSFDGKSLYHDIALLELDNPVQLDQFTVPACLVEGIGENAYLTGWTEDESQVLQKARMTKLSPRDCSNEYPTSRRLRDGVDESIQACYKDLANFKLQEISGGILQTHNKMRCMYTLVGVSTFGPSVQNTGLYTMVAAYLPWIESVVWPED